MRNIVTIIGNITRYIASLSYYSIMFLPNKTYDLLNGIFNMVLKLTKINTGANTAKNESVDPAGSNSETHQTVTQPQPDCGTGGSPDSPKVTANQLQTSQDITTAGSPCSPKATESESSPLLNPMYLEHSKKSRRKANQRKIHLSVEQYKMEELRNGADIAANAVEEDIEADILNNLNGISTPPRPTEPDQPQSGTTTQDITDKRSKTSSSTREFEELEKALGEVDETAHSAYGTVNPLSPNH